MDSTNALTADDLALAGARDSEEHRDDSVPSSRLGRIVDEKLLLQSTALASAANAIIITDAKGNILQANPAFIALTGYALEEVIGQNPRLLKSGKQPPAFYRELWRTILSGQTWRGEVINRRKDGSLFTADHTVTPFRSETGRITHFIGILNDVTERNLAEEALRVSHAQMRQVLEHAPVVLYALKVEEEKFVPHLVSENMTALLGFVVTETMTYEWWQGQLHPEDRERAVAGVAKTLLTGENRTEYRLRHKNGGYRWIEDQRRLVRDATGAPTELIGVWTDISERKHAEETVREMSGHATRGYRKTAVRDLAILAGSTVGFLWLAHVFNWFKPALQWMLEHVKDQLDEGLFTLLFLAVGLGVFAFRRWRETHSELVIRQHGQSALQRLHDELDWRVKLRTAELVRANQVLRHEVADRKKADETLATERTLLRTLIDQIPDPIYVKDGASRFLVANSRTAQVMGAASPAELLGRTDADFFPADIAAAFRADEERVLSGRPQINKEETTRIADGSSRVLLTTKLPLRDAQQNVVGVVGIGHDVTEQRQTEAVRVRMAEIVSGMSEACYAIDADWRFTFVNDRMETLLHCRREEMLGRTLWEFFEQLLGTSQEQHLRRVMRDRVPVAFEALSPIAGRWLDIRLFPSGDGLAAFLLDIQPRKETEARLELFRTLMDRSHECIEVVDPVTGQMLDVNDATCVQHGYTREEYLQLTVFDVRPSLSREKFLTIQDRLKDAGALVIEAVHRRKDGTEFPIELSLNRIEFDRTYVVAMGRDITERRRAEATLRESEERFRQVVENIHEVFWLLDVADNRVLYVSPGYATIWGRTPASIYESRTDWSDSIFPEDRTRVLEAARTKQVRGDYDETYRIVRPDGSVRWVRDRAFPIRDEAEVVRRMVGIAEDITERKNFEEQFLRAQRLESIGMLAAGIAHDFNNVLAPIGMVGPLLRQHVTEESDLALLAMLEKNTERGAALVRQILGFVHGIGGEPRLVQVKHLLHDIGRVIAETFPKAISLRETVAGDLWPILANPTQIHQVLLNLCVNARDAMPDGGVLRLSAENLRLDETAAAAIAGAKPGAWLVISVEDTGTGIPPEVLERIWEPFFTTKPADKGTGLGLSTVRGIVETHHGFIALQTTPGRGTTFRVYLPAAETGVVGDAAAAAVAPARGHNELILLADDEPLIRETASVILAQAGYQVVTADDGAQAVAIFEARAGEIALVITDVDMPTLDGTALARIVHALRPEMKILTMSGLARREPRGKSAASDPAFMQKPFTSELLLNHVQQLLRESAPSL